MIIEADVYFEHHGVKGQRWGVRKEQSQSTTSSKSHRNRNIALAAGTVAIGAAFTAILLKSKGNARVHDYGYSFPTIDIGPMGLSGRRFFEHHGVKGQRWGVVKKDASAGNTSSNQSQPLNQHEKAILSKLDPDGTQSERLKGMFGPTPVKTSTTSTKLVPESTDHHLTPGQKHAIILGAKFAAAGLATYGLYKVGQNAQENLLGIKNAEPEFKMFMKTMNKTKLGVNRGLSKEFIEKLSDKPIHLSAGSIVKRISTEAETEIRPGGFYAAHKPEDVERYKAVLPIFWKQWGMAKAEGHVVSLKAVEDIKAPSPKETFSIFKELIGDLGPGDPTVRARKVLPRHALNWNNSEDPMTQLFFEKLKKRGFNAVIDINDAGSIGDTPLRILEGKSFQISGVETLSASAIKAAQDNILALKHILMSFIRNARGVLNGYR